MECLCMERLVRRKHKFGWELVVNVTCVACSYPDILPLINETLKRRSIATPACRSILPTNCYHVKMLLRLIIKRTFGEK